jgi:hypothetical protein
MHTSAPPLSMHPSHAYTPTQRYQFTHPSRSVKVNALVDGIRLDMQFPNAMLNVELDGPAHRYGVRHTAYGTARNMDHYAHPCYAHAMIPPAMLP